MGDIAFNIFKDVDLNKTVDLEINKDVNVNVNIDDQLATAEADAEAFGSPALAEVDAYTFVTPNEAFAYAESTAAIDDLMPPTAIIGDRVWIEEDGNGLQDSGEPGLDGVLVTLTGNNIAPMTTTTNAEGLYLFTGLPAGTYRVEFDISGILCIGGACRFTQGEVGNDDTIDSDVIFITGNGTIGTTGEINLAPGEINLNIDAGIVPGTVPTIV